MKTIQLKVQSRTEVGKKNTKALRREGMVPCVIYGNGSNTHVFLDEKALSPIVFSPESFLIELDIEGKKVPVILQDIDYHPVKDGVLHVDFLAVDEQKKVKVSIPVQTEGYAEGLRKGGRMNIIQRKLRVRGFLKDIPDYIVLNVEKLQLQQSIKVSDVSIANVDILNAPSSVVLSIAMTRAAKSAASSGGAEADSNTGSEASE